MDFTFTAERDGTHSETKLVYRCNEVSLEELVEEIQGFLKACGFVFYELEVHRTPPFEDE